MLTQLVQRKVAKPVRRKDLAIVLLASFCLCSIGLNSCSAPPADLRSLLPADSLIYLESNDLGGLMSAITERPAFREAAKEVPDLSLLNGVKLAIAVTGFETREQPVTDENSVLSFTPRFVAILDTNAWNFQAQKFTEEKLGSFIDDVYGGEVLLETSDKSEGKYFVWTSNDGRKAYGLVQGSVVYFGNDESAIEKCLAVKRGEAEPISKNPKITTGDRLAFGYVSPEGIAQIANIAGLSLAKQSSEEGEVQGFVARVLPEIVRNSLKDATWTATSSSDGIVDTFNVSMSPDVSSVLNETLVPSKVRAELPSNLGIGGAVSVSHYNLKDPLVAWRSLVLSAGKATDPTSGSLIVGFSDSVFEPYGIEDPEKFLKSVEPEIYTVRFDESGENAVAVAKVKDPSMFEQSIAKELKAVKPVTEADRSVRRSADGELMLMTMPSGLVFIGDTNSVEKLLNKSEGELTFAKRMFESDALAATTGVDKALASKMVELIAEPKSSDTAVNSQFITETRFSRNGLERRTISDFGLVGWILSHLEKDE